MAKVKKRILIAFIDEWAAYNPTIDNLVTLLKQEHDVEVLCFDNGRFRVDGLDTSVYTTLRIEDPDVVNSSPPYRYPIAHALMRRFNSNLFMHDRVDLYTMEKIRRFGQELAKRNPDHVIAVDPVALFVCRPLFDSITFLSRELSHLRFLNWIDIKGVRDVILLTPDTYTLLFGSHKINTYIIPNSDFFQGRFEKLPSRSMICFGNISATHGMRICTEALRHLPDFSLTLQGIVSDESRNFLEKHYGDLLSSGQLKVDQRYIPQTDVVAHLKQFGIGFSCYDFDYLNTVLTRHNAYIAENFRVCSSGKLYNCLAAGVPVVASDVPGMAIVRRFDAGELLSDTSGSSVAAAVQRILSRYDNCVEGCFAAAEASDFRTHAASYLESLRTLKPAPSTNRGHRLLRMGAFAASLDAGFRRTLMRRLSELKSDLGGRDSVLYGTGPQAEFILRKSSGIGLHFKAVADGDCRKWGQRIGSLRVIDPEDILCHASDVVVSSYSHENEISEYLESQYGSRMQIHKLFASEP